jgi:hypothetical protein
MPQVVFVVISELTVVCAMAEEAMNKLTIRIQKERVNIFIMNIPCLVGSYLQEVSADV